MLSSFGVKRKRQVAEMCGAGQDPDQMQEIVRLREVALRTTGEVSLAIDAIQMAEHNVPNQICKPSEIGRPKVEALAELARDLTEVHIGGRNERYRGQRLHGVVIAATDKMASRQEVWNRVKLDTGVPLYLDARMGAEFGRIYAVRSCDPEDIDFYESNLYSSADAERLPCSARSIIYCPTLVAGLVVLLVKRFALGDHLPSEVLFNLPSLHLVTSASCPAEYTSPV